MNIMGTCVIGHVNPDTDSIAAALGYAWLLRERDGIDAFAARAGALNPQTSWVLKNLDVEPPILVTDASPMFSTVMHHLDSVFPNQPLQDAWAIANRTGGVAPILNQDGTPYGLLTSRSLFNFLVRELGVSPRRQEIKIRELMEKPCGEAADLKVPVFHANSRIRDSLHRILREEGDEFWVVDENGQYVGICRQRELLNPPRLKIILVDHNEPQQALGSLDEAELVEILDHHRLGNPSTHTPIRFTVDTVGSTSTLVTEQVENAGLSLPPSMAGVLLAGLLSDTLILTSPTTTDRDKIAAERLGRWAFIGGGPLEGEEIKSYGQKVLQAGAGLSYRTPEEIVSNDMKIYDSGGFHFSISQVEVSDLVQVEEHLANLTRALQDLQNRRGLDFTMLLVTDVVCGSSRLILSNTPAVLDGLPYPPNPDGTRMAEGVVSRKKQLLPAVLGLLEE